jgi:pimeloyl-ACP methyl ester carboxylesterase
VARSRDGVEVAYATRGVGADADGLTVVPKDVGHFLMIEDPDQFNPILTATLASFDADKVSRS